MPNDLSRDFHALDSDDAGADEQKQSQIDNSIVAFDKWHARVNTHDVVSRLDAMRGWFAGREYEEAIHISEWAAMLSEVSELRREKARLEALLMGYRS